MASNVLVMHYQTVESNVQQDATSRNEFDDQLQQINSAIDNLSQSFKGKGGRSFINWWSGPGSQHSRTIIQQMERVENKLRQIREMVEDHDATTAGLFSME
jgi:WXG100 family type VII secretion target